MSREKLGNQEGGAQMFGNSEKLSCQMHLHVDQLTRSPARGTCCSTVNVQYIPIAKVGVAWHPREKIVKSWVAVVRRGLSGISSLTAL